MALMRWRPSRRAPCSLPSQRRPGKSGCPSKRERSFASRRTPGSLRSDTSLTSRLNHVKPKGWLSLDVIHPEDVSVVLSPVQLTYLDLDIPAMTEIRFSGQCFTGPLKVHYVLPHFHSSGNYFQLQVSDSGGTTGIEWRGYDAQALGRSFDPPLPVPEGRTLRFTCGFNNQFSQSLAWGIGVNEMCVALMLVESDAIHGGVVRHSIGLSELQDGIPVVVGVCDSFRLPKGLAYEAPRAYEKTAPLYLPPDYDPEVEPPGLPPCLDADPSALPSAVATFDNLREHVVEPWCTFSSCHGNAAAAGLMLAGDDLHATLLEHVVAGPTELPLVSPGDPEGSWLYQTLSRCTPGPGARSMPLNAPVLLDDAVVAIVREWIASGAPA